MEQTYEVRENRNRMKENQQYDDAAYASAAYQAYCNRVCSFLKKATKKEKASLSEELYDHMESHAEALVELGWDPQEARIYAIQAMGDAEIVGKQYDEKLSSFWLWCGYVVRVLFVALALLMVGQVANRKALWSDYFAARWNPHIYANEEIKGIEPLWSEKMDIRVPTPSGKHVIRVYQTQLYQLSDGSYNAIVYMVSFPKNPFGAKTDLLRYMTMDGYPGGGFTSGSFAFYDFSARVEEGQKSVELVIHREVTDTEIRVEIPLNWEEIP